MRIRPPALLLVVLAACSAPTSNPWVALPAAGDTAGTMVTIKGTVHYTDVEGGVYSIRAEDGTNYDPLNLPAAFKKDGLAVEAEARTQPATMGINQVGPIVALTRIRNLKE
jgi:hypothetical protein